MRRSLDANPNFALAHAFYGFPLALTGRHEEAVRSAEHALRLSPNDRYVVLQASITTMLAHFGAQRYADCAVWARNMVESHPEDIRGYFMLAAALGMEGKIEAVAEARAGLLRVQPQFSLAWFAENLPPTGEFGERMREGLRRAGVPER
jgi:cytochrome c-type biogenesis protein CcmH/NrfG